MVTDLSQLFALSPTVAAGFMGQREALGQDSERMAQQKTLQDLLAARQKMQFEADAHPLDLEKLTLANQTERAKMPGVEADSRKRGLEADKMAGTLNSDIEAGNAGNYQKIYKGLGAHLGSLSTALDGVSDIEAPAVIAQGIDALGGSPKVKEAFMRRYAGLPAKEAQKRMQADSERILRENEAYAQHYDTTALTNDAHILINGNNNRTQKELEEMRINAGKYDRQKQVQSASDQWMTSVTKAQGAAKKYAAANSAAEFFRQNGEIVEAQRYAAIAAELEPQARAELNNAQQGKPGGIDVGGVTGLPTNPAASITPPSRAGTTPAPAANRPTSLQELRKMYPGVPDSKLQEAYKKKFGVDLK